MRILSDLLKSRPFWECLLSGKYLLILFMGLLAMGSALQAGFYMDDFAFIIDSKGTSTGGFHAYLFGHRIGSTEFGSMEVTVFQLIPTAMTLLTNWLFPLNSTAAHVWNLAIHLSLALLIYKVGARLLGTLRLLPSAQTCQQAAFLGALLFACHPLGTEPVHYAKCHMVQLVALFSFLATAEAVEFLTAPTRRRAGRFILLAGLCVISYFPGTVLLGINVMLAVLWAWKMGVLPRFHFDRNVLKRPLGIAGACIAAVVLLYLSWFFLYRYYLTITGWGDLYPVHIVTQGRVFWEYMLRLIVPVGLASDHYQPWSTFRDTGAVIKLAGLALFYLSALTLALRRGNPSRQALGLLLAFLLTPFVIRLLYVNIEIMVEYRAYHALPWLGLLSGVGFVTLAQRIPSQNLRWLPATAVILIFTVLSAERGRVWSSPTALAANVLEQYPLNNRARTQLQSYDLDAGNYAAILQRHEEILAVRDRINTLNAASQGRTVIDPIRADGNVIGSYQFAILARAELEGCLRALAFADHSISNLKTLLPGHFVTRPGETVSGAWPVLEAKATVERAQAAGYVPAALQPN